MIEFLFLPVIDLTPCKCPRCGKLRNYYDDEQNVNVCNCPPSDPPQRYSDYIASKKGAPGDRTP